MGIIRFAINNPIKVAVMVLLLGLFGLLSLFRIPIQLTPNVDRPLITVTTGWEGASPQEVEDNIIRRQEEKLKGLPGLVKMTSSSRDNVGEIQLEFAVGTDKNVALREVSDRLRQVSGYEDREAIDEPVVVATDTAMATPIAWLIFRAHGHDVTTYQDFVEDNVKPILERVPGVASVDVYGGREQEVQVIVDPARLAARGLTFAELERALRMHNVDISAGTITQGKRDLAIRTIGKYESLQQVLNTVVADRPGGPIYVRDVARAVKSYKKPLGFVRSEGEPVLAMPVRRETGTNVLQVMAGLRAAIDKINRQILSGPRDYMELVQVYDETKYINSAIDLVEQNIVLGGLLAIIVLMVFLRSPSATLVVAVSIPVSVVGTFLAVSLLGRNLNVVMLAGMAFAVGMVVDAAVVVLENIYRHRQMGKDRLEAALDGTREVWGAVLAGALTTMAVFIPVLTVQQEAGQLFRDIAVAIASAVGLSLVVAVTVIPSLSARILGRTGAATTGRRLRDLPHSKQFWLIAVGPVALVPLSLVLISNRAAMLVLTAWLGWLALCLLGFVGQRARPEASRFTRWVAAAVYWINGRVWARLAVVGGLTGASLYLSWRLIPPQTYLPNGNRNMVFGMLFSPPGYSLDEFDRIGRIIEPALAPYWQCEPGSPQHQQLSRQWQQLYQRQIRPTMQQQIERIDRQLAALQQQLARASGQQRSMLQGQINSLRRKRGELSLVMNEMAVSPPPIDHFFYVAYMGRAFMGTISKQEGVVKPVANLLNVIGRKIPDCYAVFIQPSIFGFRSSGNSLEVDVRGDDLQKVAAAAGALFAACAGRFGDPPEASPINFARGRHEVRFRPNQEKAKDVGLTVRDVGFIIRAAVDGAIVGEFRDHGKTIDLTLKLAGTANRPPKAIEQIPLYTPTGRIIPLAAVVDRIDTTALQQINHIEQQRSVTLTVRAPEGVALDTLQQAVQEIVTQLRRQGAIDPSITITYAGNASRLAQTRNALIGQWRGLTVQSLTSFCSSRFFIALLVIFLLMAALFESFLYPFVILFSVPLAAVGGFIGLHLSYWYSLANPVQPIQLFDVLTALGFIILIGVVVNNAILIVHQALNNMRYAAMPPRQAISESVRTRIRPIFMTSLTSVFAMGPLCLRTGPGSELYRGLGSVMVGGLLVATIFTLFLVPALFSLTMAARDKLISAVGRLVRPAAALPATPGGGDGQ